MTGEGLDELRETIASKLSARLVPVDLLVPYKDGDILDMLHQQAADLHRERPRRRRARDRQAPGSACGAAWSAFRAPAAV